PDLAAGTPLAGAYGRSVAGRPDGSPPTLLPGRPRSNRRIRWGSADGAFPPRPSGPRSRPGPGARRWPRTVRRPRHQPCPPAAGGCVPNGVVRRVPSSVHSLRAGRQYGHVGNPYQYSQRQADSPAWVVTDPLPRGGHPLREDHAFCPAVYTPYAPPPLANSWRSWRASNVRKKAAWMAPSSRFARSAAMAYGTL